MTVVVGVICKEGVVIGSDSSATLSAGRVPTIEQPIQKVEVVCEEILLAGTGEGGLGQRFSSVVEKYWKTGVHKTGKDHIEIAKDLCVGCVRDFQSTGSGVGKFGALVGFVLNDNFYLCEFPWTDFQPEFKLNKMWFASMGSGQGIADPFLGFLRRTFWGDDRPTLRDGIFAVTWTLENTIKLNVGGINGPSQVGILNRENGTWKARILDDSELLEHIDFVNNAEKHLGEYKKIIQDNLTRTVPAPPILEKV